MMTIEDHGRPMREMFQKIFVGPQRATDRRRQWTQVRLGLLNDSHFNLNLARIFDWSDKFKKSVSPK